MHIIAFVTNFRLLDNYADALHLVQRHGGRCEIIALPWAGDPSSAIVPAGCDFPVRLLRPFTDFNEPAVARDALLAIARDIVEADPDFVLLPNMQSHPSSALHGLLRECGYRGKCIGLQHGLHQLWNLYNTHFCADYVFCFGRRHVERLHPRHRDRAFAVGLPKLDRLKDLATTQGGYVLFLPQGSPEPEIVNPLLAAYEKLFRMPVVIHSHPRFPGKYRHRSALPTPPVLRDTRGWSVIDYLRHCNLAITLHSITGIEALYLDKPVLLLPNAGIGAYENYPGVSEGFFPQALNDALVQLTQNPAHIGTFLDDVVGGLRFNHAERVFAALRQLQNEARYNVADAPHLAAHLAA